MVSTSALNNKESEKWRVDEIVACDEKLENNHSHNLTENKS
jgi:hypothetical protein